MKKHNVRIGKDGIKGELHVIEDEVEGAVIAERDKEVDTKCDS